MKQFLLLLFFVASTCRASAQTADLELPLNLVAGYGPLLPNLRGPNWQDESADRSWARTYPTLQGLPNDWREVKQGYILLNENQFIYQHAKAGTIPAYLYNAYRKGLYWPSDTTTLSAKPIRCFVSVVAGKNVAGKPVAMIDTDNNLDFSDEEVIDLLPVSILSQPEPASIRQIQYERYEGGRAVPVMTSVWVGLSRDQFVYTFPTHGVAVLNAGGRTDTLAVVSDYFSNPSFKSSTIVNLTDSITVAHRTRTGRLSSTLVSNVGEFIRAGSKTFRFLGVDLAKQVVRLKSVSDDDSLYSTQLYYRVPPFVATELISQQPISLTTYRGRYVLLDFWGTWCAPCRAQMPYMKEAYAQTDRNTLEIIGIAANDTPEKVKAYITKEGITWPQALADDVNRLVEMYKVQSYPTTILIDPRGRVLGKNFHGKNMVDMLSVLKPVKP